MTHPPLPPRYSARKRYDSWAVYENGRLLAVCPTETYARAVAQALTTQRAYIDLITDLIKLPRQRFSPN